jgi:ferredoxin
VRIKLDRTLCDGFGVCAERAPDLISLDEWGYASLRERAPAEVPPDREEPALRALLDCPAHAIIELASPADRPEPRAGG